MPERYASDPLVVEAARRYGIPLAVLEGVIASEAGTWDAISGIGEVGKFQIHPVQRASVEALGISWDQLKNRPDIQIAVQVPQLAYAWNEVKQAGGSDAEAAWAVVVNGQRPAEENRAREFGNIMAALGQPGTPVPVANPTTPGPYVYGGGNTQEIIVPKITQRGVPEFQTRTITTKPATGAATYGPPNPNDPKYQVLSDPVDPLSPKSFDQVAFNVDSEAYYRTEHMEELIPTGGDEVDYTEYFSTIIPLMSAKIAAGELEVSKANVEIQKRLDALTQGRQGYEALVGYSLPTGTKFIPGGGPGGVYSKLGLGEMPATTVQMNPFATAVAMMGKTPEMGATPDTSYEEAIRLANELKAASGQPAAVQPSLAAAPSTFAAALNPPSAVAPPAPYTGGSADVRARAAMQPSTGRIPPVGPALSDAYLASIEAPKEIESRYPPKQANLGDWWYNTSGQKFVWRAGGWKLASSTGY